MPLNNFAYKNGILLVSLKKIRTYSIFFIFCVIEKDKCGLLQFERGQVLMLVYINYIIVGFQILDSICKNKKK